MDKKYILQITNNLYRLTLLFPKKEPLRYKMRELADDILAECSTFKFEHHSGSAKFTQHPVLNNSIMANLEVLDGFFEVAKSQNWVSPQNILNIQQEYSKLKEDLKNFEEEKKVIEKVPEIGYQPEKNTGVKPRQLRQIPSLAINERQEKILEFLKENGRAQVWQVKQIFPEISKRTLRRDFEFLLKQGKIERIGERNDTFYVPRQSAGQLLG